MNPLLLLLAVAGRTRERESSSCLSSHIGHSNRAHFLHSMRNDVFCAIAFVVVLHQPVNELRANRSWSYFIAPFHYCYFDFDGQPNAIIIRCWCICCSLLLMRLRCVAQYFSWFRSHCCCRGCRQQPSIVRTINKNQCATRPGAICIQHSAISIKCSPTNIPNAHMCNAPLGDIDILPNGAQQRVNERLNGDAERWLKLWLRSTMDAFVRCRRWCERVTHKHTHMCVCVCE